MDKKNVLFGRIVSGMRSIKLIEKIECFNQKPNGKITITDGGIYDGKVKKNASTTEASKTKAAPAPASSEPVVAPTLNVQAKMAWGGMIKKIAPVVDLIDDMGV